MLLAHRLSWYMFSPDEDHSRHFQKVYDDVLITRDEIIDMLLAEARIDGIRIPPKESITIPFG